jgi:hypothetical protein
MKLIVDTSKKHVMVSREPVEKADERGKQKVERGTGRPMWSTQVFVQDHEGGEVINVTTAGEKPDVAVGQIVTLVSLEALPWATNEVFSVAVNRSDIA